MLLYRLHLISMASHIKPSYIPKPRHITFRSNTSTYNSCLRTGVNYIFFKGSLIRHRESREVHRGAKTHLRKFEHIIDTISEHKKDFGVYSLSMFGHVTPPLFTSKSSFRVSNNGIWLTFNNSAKRMFSVETTPKSDLTDTSSSEAVPAKDGNISGVLQKLFAFNKRRKQFWAAAHKNVNTIDSSCVLAREAQKETKSFESETGIKQKQRTRNRKKKGETSDSQSSANIVSAESSPPVANSSCVLAREAQKEAKSFESETGIKQKQRTQNRKKKGETSDSQSSAKIVSAESSPPVAKNSSTGITTKKKKKKIGLSISGVKSVKLFPLYPPVGKSVVVVESPTKAMIIQRFLGDMYEVLPSHGHMRDLVARAGAVRPDEDFRMVWEVPSSAWGHLNRLKVAISGANNLILASDPDREGEAIAWHVIEMLRLQDALRKDVTVARVTFHEITESAVISALQTPRELDVNLVNAYLARRALDYLIGFNISPLLWRKLPGCQSAGRVQSAALAVVCDRETEIEEFKPQEYWKLEATFIPKRASSSPTNCFVPSYLSRFGSIKLTQLSIGSETEAKIIKQIASASCFSITGVERSIINKNPPTPYITSTLQQDAANKLHFSAPYTMKLAQKLYEGIEFSDGKAAGLITYMRTDSSYISDEAAEEICSLITERYELDCVASRPLNCFKKIENAREAHEAIRPTDIRRLPSMLAGVLDDDSLKLYTLIWARTMASQMETAKVDQIQLDIGNNDGSVLFRASCSSIAFPRFTSVYEDTETKAIRDVETEAFGRGELYDILNNLKLGDQTKAIRDVETEVFGRGELYDILNNLKLGDQLSLSNIELKQHHTQPPPRYSEASLIRKLEELGIGRPSTYASTTKALQDRNYVTAKSGVLFPEFRGRMVSAFLSRYFTEVTDYSFIADVETKLDKVSGGLTKWKRLLSDYWTKFRDYCGHADKVHVHQVEKMLEKTFGKFLFSSLPYANRTCPSCSEGTLIFKVSKFGAGFFIGCDQHPKCKFIAKTLYGEEEDDEVPESNFSGDEPKLLGAHPTSGEKVLLKGGPYGSYVQLGEDSNRYVPKRAHVSKTKDVNLVTLEHALDLLRYPRTLGNHPVDGQPVVIKISKLGFTIRHRRSIARVPKGFPANEITMEKAVEFLSGPNVLLCGRPKGEAKREESYDV